MSVDYTQCWILQSKTPHGLSNGDPVTVTGTGRGQIDYGRYAVDVMSDYLVALLEIEYAGDDSGDYPQSAYVPNPYGGYIETGYIRRAVQRITDLSHLEGLTVVGLGDGSVIGGLVVTNGQVDLPDYYADVILGLPYEPVFEPIGLNATASGSALAQTKRIRGVRVRFKDTLGGTYSTDVLRYHVISSVGTSNYGGEISFREVVFRDTADTTSHTPELFTGWLDIPIEQDHDLEPRIILKQDAPLPFTILGVTYLFEVTEKLGAQ